VRKNVHSISSNHHAIIDLCENHFIVKYLQTKSLKIDIEIKHTKYVTKKVAINYKRLFYLIYFSILYYLFIFFFY